MELIPFSWQSAHRWLSHKPGGRGCHYFPPGPRHGYFPSQRDHPLWPVPNYTAWWQRHTGV